jgi:Cdc6-like AAA superfamily ATPase
MQHQQALVLEDIDSVVNRFEAVTPDSPFYVNFEDLRGNFQEREILRALNVKASKGVYSFTNAKNYDNKTLLFLAGMRGSGKTSELSRYAKNLNKKSCFFVITCNIDQGLNMDRVEYMDILIFQLEKLLERTAAANLAIDDSILKSMLAWFQTIETNINKKLKAEGSAEISVGAKQDAAFSISGILAQLLGINANIRGGLTGSVERADSIRTTVRNNFTDFALKFNTFVEQVNEQLRKEQKANEILFIIDGLEKTMAVAMRRKIIMEESNRIIQIKANTVFTLPIELMKETQHINNMFATVISFPFVKLIHKDGTKVAAAYAKFREMIEKRIALNLFENDKTIDRIIALSGGSPRQLLQIIEQANWKADEDKGIITMKNVEDAAQKLGTEMAAYLTEDEFKVLSELKNHLLQKTVIKNTAVLLNLLEQGIVLEYNDNTYKRVNPLMELAEIYQQEVVKK